MRKVTITILIAILMAIPILGLFTSDVSAASSRVAVIKELKGTVKVKKAGGSKEFTAFSKMSLNEGDILSVGSKGSAVLQFANGSSEDDRMTVASNTTLSFSKLSNKKGTTTKVSMFNGSAWVDVKSISNKDDEFTLETPTAIMGVRGTHLLVSVNPVSGATRLTVAAGVVNTRTTDANDPQIQNVVPTKNALITKDSQGDGEITIAQVDLEQLMKQSDTQIIEAILGASADIALENENKKNLYEQAIDGDLQENDKQNFENIAGAIIAQAVKTQAIDQGRLSALLADVKAKTGLTIDLSKSELKISDADKAKQDLQKLKEKEALDHAKAEKQREQTEREKNASLLEELKNQRDKKAKENSDLLADKSKKAIEQYEQGLSEADKQRFEQSRKDREAEKSQAPSQTIPQTGGGPGGSPGTSPDNNPGGGQTNKSNDATLGNVILQGNYGMGGRSANTLPGTTTPVVVSYNPAFHPDTTNYNATVGEEIDSVNVKPFVAESHATVTVNGQSLDTVTGSATIPLSGGMNAIYVVVTAEDGATTKNYYFFVDKHLPHSGLPEGLTSWKTTLSDNSEVTWNPSQLDSLVYNAGVATAVYGLSMQLDYDESVVGWIDLKATDELGNVEPLKWTASGQVKTLTGLSSGLYEIKLQLRAPNEAYIGEPVYLYFHNQTAVPNWEAIEKPFSVHRMEDITKEVPYANPAQTIMMVPLPVTEVLLMGSDPGYLVNRGVTVNGVVPVDESVLPLSYGENIIRVPVVDHTGYYHYTYEFKMMRTDTPEGLNGWAIEKSDGLNTGFNVVKDMVANGEYRHFVEVPSGNTEFHLIVNPDASTAINGQLVDLQSDAIPTILNRGDQMILLDLATDGYYRYLLQIYVDGVYNEYELVFKVGNPIWHDLISGDIEVAGWPVMPTVGGAHESFSIMLPPGNENEERFIEFLEADGKDVQVFRGNEQLSGGDYINLGILAPVSVNDFEIRLFEPTHQLAPKVYHLTVYSGEIPQDLRIASIAALDDALSPVSVLPQETWGLTYKSDDIDPAANSVSISIQLNDDDNGEIARVRVDQGSPISSVNGETLIPLSPVGATSVQVVVRSKLTGHEICYTLIFPKA